MHTPRPCHANAAPQDFFNAELDINNLGCTGPTPYYNNRTGREVCALRYKNIGSFEGIDIDLVIRNTSEYYPNNVDRNGINGQFGRACCQRGHALA